MNFSNALGFVSIGLMMWLLPLLAPGWFPHNAVDGSSTRALWSELMGLVQFGLGMAFLIRDTAIPAVRRVHAATVAALRRGALATADWQTDHAPKSVLAVTFAPAQPTPANSVSREPAALPRDHIAHWRSRALASEHRLAQLTLRWYALLGEYGLNSPALSMLRHQPSLLHLVGPNLLAFEHDDQKAPELQILALLREHLAEQREPRRQSA